MRCLLYLSRSDSASSCLCHYVNKAFNLLETSYVESIPVKSRNLMQVTDEPISICKSEKLSNTIQRQEIAIFVHHPSEPWK